MNAKAGNDEIDASNPLVCLFPGACQATRDRDEIHAGTGNDEINVVDHVSSTDPNKDVGNDTVYCGSGEDTALVDQRDKTSGCEHVTKS